MELNQNLLTFDEERHLYFYDGKEIPSITQIVAPKIDGSFEVVKKAAQEGTLIHKAVEKFLKGIISITDENYNAAQTICECLFKIFPRNEYVFICEKKGVGVQPNYPADLFAGTADILVYAIDYRKGKEVKNLVAIIDLKTGQIHGWHSAQLGGYNRIFSNGIIANYVLYYDKTNNVCKEKYIEYGEAVKKFEIALNDYRLKNNSSGFELSTIIDEKTLETINHMQLFILKRKEEIEKTQAALEAVKAKIMAAMKDNKVSKFETDKMSVVYIAESERKGVDSEKLKTAYPHIYSEVLKTSKIAENIRIKFK